MYGCIAYDRPNVSVNQYTRFFFALKNTHGAALSLEPKSIVRMDKKRMQSIV